MKTSDTINELAGALAKAQAIMGNAHMDKTNPHFKSRYATLASVRDAITPPVRAFGLRSIRLRASHHEQNHTKHWQ